MSAPRVSLAALGLAGLGLAAALGGPASAQALPGVVLPGLQPDPLADPAFAVQQEALRRRELQLQNDLSVLDAQLRTERALREVEAQRVRPVLPPPYVPRKPAAAGESAPATPGFAAIPDDRLAASNARVRAAAEDRP